MASKETNKKRRKQKAVGAVQIAGGAYLGQQTVRSGLPRLLGVRLESHSTSHGKAKAILRNGGYLDPGKSGTGAMSNLPGENVAFVKGRVFVTGRYPDKNFKPTRNLLSDVDVDNPLSQILYKRFQRRAYRSQAGIDRVKLAKQGPYGRESIKNVSRLSIPFAEHSTGRTLYVGGSDQYFKKNFVPDPDDVAMMSDKKIKLTGNRFTATRDAIKREGFVNILKKSPKSRIAVGAGLLGVGGYITYQGVKKGIENIKGDIKVKGFVRKGKLVKAYKRKRDSGK